MTHRPQIPYKEWLAIITAWVLIMYFYGFIAFWGTSSFLREGTITDYMGTWPAQLEMIMGGLFFGLLFAIVNTLTEWSPLRKRSLGVIIATRSGLYIFAWLGVVALTAFLYRALSIVSEEALEELIHLPPLYVASLFLYFAVFSVLLNFILMMSRKFGPGNLSKLITGKYQNPKEEERIFLFLDLKGSTTIAERLGHKTYSRLLRDCYHDLTDIVLSHKAEIYQYVGDEVVLCWGIRDGLKDLNCLKTFFAFETRLQQRGHFYSQRYNTAPEFKGGMDMGKVTAAEIGDIKREIAYHGAVLNRASRIQEQCKVFDQRLLVSEDLEKNLTRMNGFTKHLVGTLNLRGIRKAVPVYSIGLSDR